MKTRFLDDQIPTEKLVFGNRVIEGRVVIGLDLADHDLVRHAWLRPGTLAPPRDGTCRVHREETDFYHHCE